MNDTITCHNYTPGRRHQKVIGRVGSTVLPFTVTIPQLVVVIVVVPILLATAPAWSPIAPAPLVVPGVTVAAACAVRFARIEGRSPLWAAIGRLQLVLAPAGGVTAGRPTRRPRVHHTSCTVTLLTDPHDPASVAGLDDPTTFAALDNPPPTPDLDVATLTVPVAGGDRGGVSRQWRCLDAA